MTIYKRLKKLTKEAIEETCKDFKNYNVSYGREKFVRYDDGIIFIELYDRFNEFARIAKANNPNNFIIRFSEPIMKNLSDERIKKTIIHELAHAKAGLENGHNKKWKKAMIEYGQKPNRTNPIREDIKKKMAKYQAVCTNCGTKNYYKRKGKFIKATERAKGNRSSWRCGKCGSNEHWVINYL